MPYAIPISVCFSFCKMDPYFFILVFVIFVASQVIVITYPCFKHADVRLSESVTPISYDLTLDPDIHAGSYTGDVTISIRLTRPINTISLHNRNLSINECSVYDVIGTVREIEMTYANNSLETYNVKLRQELPLGIYSVRLKFNGSLLNKLQGFYRSSYYVDGTKR